MYCYVYDDFVQDRKYERDLSAVENRITDLGLQGKIVRLALFRDPQEAIKKEVRGGAKTVVVVGNDETVHKVINAVVDSDAVLALIPIGAPTILAKIFGVPSGVGACDVLSRRIIEKIDVGVIGKYRFLTGVGFPMASTLVRYGKQFDMMTTKKGALEIRNLCVTDPREPSDVSDPTDGKLDVVITTQNRKGLRTTDALSKVPMEEFEVVFDKSVDALVDGAVIKGETFQVSTERGVLSAVVGRERMF